MQVIVLKKHKLCHILARKKESEKPIILSKLRKNNTKILFL